MAEKIFFFNINISGTIKSYKDKISFTNLDTQKKLKFRIKFVRQGIFSGNKNSYRNYPVYRKLRLYSAALAQEKQDIYLR